mmetsp:Transcript_73438/g.195118  ORF Transcript_73438/g.195118 Transcript_73438/m.195118 type:complete len:257 (-) Transcript_73438:613-1383(-)
MRSKLRSKASAYRTSGCSGLVSKASSRPSSPAICSRASTPMFTRGRRAFSSVMCTSAFRTTNHSRAFHSSSWESCTWKSKQLFMPTTGCMYSPMESSFKCTSAWNIASPAVVPANQAGSKRFTCHLDLARSSWVFGSNENIGSRPSRMRTCSANAKYSRFRAAVGFEVGAMRAVLDSSSNVIAYIPVATGAKPIFRAQGRFRGTRSTFQPMSYSARLDLFSSASRRLRLFSSLLARWSISWAWHSPCTKGPSSSAR